ncbi:hypothetical protein ABW19_dt0207095 [Dactylella cylindrospora]|nr:hypothetical protein ABW19_dt0207095 [Dactylella cylindrospora]
MTTSSTNKRTGLTGPCLRLVYNLEHTQTLVNKIASDRPEPLTGYAKSIAVSAMGMIPKAFKFENGQVKLEDESIEGDPERDPYCQEEYAQRKWAKLMFCELSKLFISLPRGVTELTMRDFDIPLKVPKFEQLDILFCIALNHALYQFRPQNLRKVNVFASDLAHFEALWFRTGLPIRDLSSVFDPNPLEILAPSRDHAHLAKVTELNIAVKKDDLWSLVSMLNEFCGRLDNLSKLSARTTPVPSEVFHGFKIPNAYSLRHLVLEGLCSSDRTFISLARDLVNVTYLRLYSSDIASEARVQGLDLKSLVDPAIGDITWGHFFETLSKLDKLVDFRVANLSYTTIRRSFTSLPSERLWLFTDRWDDFIRFAALRDTLVQRRESSGLPRDMWLSDLCLDGRWDKDEPEGDPTVGLTVSLLENHSKYGPFMMRRANIGMYTSDSDFDTETDDDDIEGSIDGGENSHNGEFGDEEEGDINREDQEGSSDEEK